MTSNHHGSYALGDTHATMDRTTGSDVARRSESLKPTLSWDCRLKLACMNAELLVNAGQHTALNTFPGLVHTARHVMEAGNA